MEEELKLCVFIVIAGIKLTKLLGFVLPAGFIAYCITL